MTTPPVTAPTTEPGAAHPVPAGTRLTLDTSTRRYHRDRVLLGGSPLRLLRLRPAAAETLREWLAGTPVGADPRHGLLARRLVDAGLLHPVDAPARYTATDVTAVIPVRDNASGVARVLAATTDLGHRIVVDDGSAAPLLHATVRHPESAGPAAARNTGWRRAATPLVAFLDSDTEPQPGWLDPLLPLFTDPAVLAVAPRIATSSGDTALHRYESTRGSLDLGPHPGPVRPMSRISYVPSAALLVRRDALSTLDGFDERLRFGEDVDLVWRLIDLGGTVRYQPESVVCHDPRDTLGRWLRQRFDYGTSAAPLAVRHPRALSCARLPLGSAITAAALLLGRRRLAVVLAVTTAALLPRRLPGLPPAAALGVATHSHLGAARLLTDAARRAWWPLALLTRPGRRLLAVSLLPIAAESLARRGKLDPVRWAALRLADDLAYSAGVWAGCLRDRTLTPLLPQFTGLPRLPKRITESVWYHRLSGLSRHGRYPDGDHR